MGRTIDRTNLPQELRKALAELFLSERIGDLGDEASLLREGILDSTGILELVAHLEETYELEVADEEIVPENFDSIGALCRYLSAKLGQ